MATFGIRTLTIEIRDIAAQLVGFGNATPLATHFAINPHHAPFLIEFQAELAHTLDRVPSDLNRLSELIDPTWIEQTLQATVRCPQI